MFIGLSLAAQIQSWIFEKKKTVCDELRDLVPFVPFKKREKHPWRSVNFRKIAV